MKINSEQQVALLNKITSTPAVKNETDDVTGNKSVTLDNDRIELSITSKHIDQRRFAAAAAAGEQNVVGRQAGDELAQVALDRFLLGVDALQRAHQGAVGEHVGAGGHDLVAGLQPRGDLGAAGQTQRHAVDAALRGLDRRLRLPARGPGGDPPLL